MSATARDLWAAFAALNPLEQQRVPVEILRRSAGTDALPGTALDEPADELFQAYDAEEKASAHD